MTIIEAAAVSSPRRVAPRRPVGGSITRRHPARQRPAGAAVRYRGTGVAVSRGPHRRRPISPGATAALALLAALITVWLGLVAQFGAAVNRSTAEIPDQIGVVRVEPGETLPHLAARVAPGAPAAAVTERIRELNALDSVTLTAGQTLIAPIG